MSTQISSLWVGLTGNTAGLAKSFQSAIAPIGNVIGQLRGASGALSAVHAKAELLKGVGELNIAGAQTLASLQTTLAAARAEFSKFANSQDVQVAIEIGREQLAETWLKAKSTLQSFAQRSGISVAANVVQQKTQAVAAKAQTITAAVAVKADSVKAWFDDQKRRFARPILLRIQLAGRNVQDQVARVRAQLDALKKYRAVRITLSAINAIAAPAKAALASLGPLRTLAGKGLVVALRATHFGIAAGVSAAQKLIGGLYRFAERVGVIKGISAAAAAASAALRSIGSGMTATLRTATRFGAGAARAVLSFGKGLLTAAGRAASFVSGIAPARAALRSLGNAATATLGKLKSLGGKLLAFTGIGAAIGGAFAAIGGIGKGFKLAAEMEQAQVAMETMLGSADAAKVVLKDLTDFAAATPFEMPELVNSTKKLIAFGVEQKKLMPTLNAIGDIAAGVGAPVDELAELYGKAKVQGRLFAQDINQLTGRGIPIIQELAKQFGVSEGEVKGLIAQGKVGFPQLEKAFASMTGEGGRFQGMMAKQSGTLGGLLSTLSDTIGMSLMGIANTIIDAFNLREGIKALTSGLASAGNAVGAWVQSIAPKIRSFAVAAFNAFRGLYQTAAPIVGQIFSTVSNVFTRLVPTILNLGRQLWSGVTATFAGIYQAVAPIISATTDWAAANWQSMLVTAVKFGQSLAGYWRASMGFLLDVANIVWSGLANVWAWGSQFITGETAAAGANVNGIVGGIGDALKWMGEMFSTALGVAEFAMNNWRDVADLAVTKAMLGIVTFANQVQYFFTDVIPATLTWFAENWRDILTDVFNLSTTVFSNLASNIGSILSNLPGLIAGTTSFSELWTPLTDGFEATLKEFPKIAEREVGGLEAALAADADALSAQLGKGLGEHLAARDKLAEEAAKRITNTLTSDVAKVEAPEIEAPKVEAPELPTIDPIQLTPELTEDTLTVKVNPEIGKATALTAGSAEAQRAMVLGRLMDRQAAAPKPPAQPVAPKPAQPEGPRPAVESARPSGEMRDVAAQLIQKLIDAAKKQTARLDDIAANTQALRELQVV
jgi:tape measure domain-containing protein